MFCARRGEMEIVVGRTIQRMTLDTTRGFREVLEKVVRNLLSAVEGVRESRWTVQIGILREIEGRGQKQ
jgi:hypothetical protein